MKCCIHIPKLLEFALNVVCDDVALRGKQCLKTPIPYPLYLRCIMTYADKYDERRYSIYRFFRDLLHDDGVDVTIGRIYPNVLDHVIFDDDDVDAELLREVAQSPLVDDAIASIHRFASRCLAADKSEMLVRVMSQCASGSGSLERPIIDVLLFYGAKLDQNDEDYFYIARIRGTNDDVQNAIENDGVITEYDVIRAVESGNCDTIKSVRGAYRESIDLVCCNVNLINATVQSMKLLELLKITQRGKHYQFSHIPSFDVLHWILYHKMMKHDALMSDIASNASRYSGHYFDMLRYLIEQRNITVPRDILANDSLHYTTDLGVFDYLIGHGIDVNAVDDCHGQYVLEYSPMFLRYWMDKGLVIKSNDARSLIQCTSQGMTAPVLEMMMDKYSMNVNAEDQYGNTALHYVCALGKCDVVEMLLRRGADVNKRNVDGQTPYNVTSDDRIKQLCMKYACKRRK